MGATEDAALRRPSRSPAGAPPSQAAARPGARGLADQPSRSHLSRAAGQGGERTNRERRITMRVFIAGASGAIGTRLVPQLVERGHEVVGTYHTPGKGERLRALGAEPV